MNEDRSGRRTARSRVATALAVVAMAVAACFPVAAAPTSSPGGTGVASHPVGSQVAAASPSVAAVTIAPTGGLPAAPQVPVASNPPLPSVPVGSIAPTSPQAVPVVVDPAVLERALKTRLDQARAKAGIPGVSVTILWPDGRSWTGTSGLADVGHKLPVTADTGFALASVSKTFTAALVMRLVEQGRLKLTDPVATLLPGRKLDPRITVRMLLDHTSGLADFFRNGTIDPPLQRHKDATWTPDQALSYVGKPAFPPGRGWYYSNTNYLLLGLVVEQVTGRPLADEIRGELLGPLGLHNTWYQSVEPPIVVPAHGYRLVRTSSKLRPIDVTGTSEVVPFRSVVTAAGGAGSIASTSGDAANWIRALGQGEVVAPSTLVEMLKDVAITTRYHARIAYGLGLQAVPVLGRPAIGHSGRFLGFRSVIRYFPNERIAIAVLTNQSGIDPMRIATPLLELALPPLPCPPSCPAHR